MYVDLACINVSNNTVSTKTVRVPGPELPVSYTRCVGQMWQLLLQSMPESK